MLKNKSFKQFFRRFARGRQEQVESLGQMADEQINRHFFRRLGRLFAVRRFLIGWISLVLLLGLVVFLQFSVLKHNAEKTVFVDGGIFNEGIVGEYTNINPIYASGSVDTSASKLVFSSLFSYDNQGRLTADLAQSIVVNKTETEYTVKLKDNLYWHDGEKLTADDVAFTFNTIKNPDAESFLLPSWKNIMIEAADEQTVIFKLKDALSPFPHSLTTGIIPKHILGDVPPDQLRSNDFNTINPVGSGPFKFDVVEVDAIDSGESNKRQIGFQSFQDYYKGPPRLSRYVIKTYDTQEELLEAYDKKNVQAIGGLFPASPDLARDAKSEVHSTPLSAQVMVFFKTTEGVLADSSVRQALVLGANRKKAINSVGYPLRVDDSPILPYQPGYNEKLIQKTGNLKQAKKILDKAGWKFDPAKGLRVKDKKPLKFNLYAESSAEYTAVAQTLKNQWQELGVNVQLNLSEPGELKSIVAGHTYDALLSAISTGADPDVFAYWHSSQADPRSPTRLNFSEYKSDKADESLVAGRSRSDPKIRAAKYQPFLKAWLKDNPALALYRPGYTYVVRSPFEGFNAKQLVSPTDRYAEVENWAIRQDKVL